MLRSEIRSTDMTMNTTKTNMVAKSPRSSSTPRQTWSAETQRKLPRPIVFWSLNEKTAFRRNRVVQTRMNMIMDDIATQKESSRRWIRYEAHKFRQRSGRYFSHPCGNSSEKQNVNIAPPAWIHKHISKIDSNTVNDKETQDDLDNNSDVEDQEVTDISTKKSGIITQAHKPVVKFSVSEEVKEIAQRPKTSADGTDRATSCSHTSVRSMSALHYRDKSDIQNQNTRQKSAVPTVYRCVHKNDKCRTDNSECQPLTPSPNQSCGETSGILRRSDTFFDRSKAVCELRIDLKKKANLRKSGVTQAMFTINDALQMERQHFSESRAKILRYINSVEAVKRAERSIINKWNRGTIEQELSL